MLWRGLVRCLLRCAVLCLCRHAGRCAVCVPADASSEAGHDVLSHHVRGRQKPGQEVHGESESSGPPSNTSSTSRARTQGSSAGWHTSQSRLHPAPSRSTPLLGQLQRWAPRRGSVAAQHQRLSITSSPHVQHTPLFHHPHGTPAPNTLSGSLSARGGALSSLVQAAVGAMWANPPLWRCDGGCCGHSWAGSLLLAGHAQGS